MESEPKAQRLQEFFNQNKFDALTKAQIEDVVFLIEDAAKRTIEQIKSKTI